MRGYMSPLHNCGFTLDDLTTLGSLCDDSCDPQYPFLNLLLELWEPMEVDNLEEAEKYLRFLSECKRLRIELDSNPNSGKTLRPTQLPELEESQHLRIHGHLELFSMNGILNIPHSELHSATSAYTTATAVLLAPNDRIFKMLLSLPDRIKSEYLIVLVNWDMLSYFFVRLMRNMYLDLPLVAVTDLDPHHLDLFTFLDTPFDDIEHCYGWDLYKDPDDLNFYDVEIVDIYWLGLRPSQCINPLHTSADAASDDLAQPSDPGFRKVICMLKVHPRFREKSHHWLDALDWFDSYGKSVLFHPCAKVCERSLLVDDGFISKKLSEKDWV